MNVADLISKFKPVDSEFEVFLDAETSLKFKVVQSYDELKHLKAESLKFVKSVMGESCPKSLKAYQGVDPATLSIAFFAKAFCVDPKWSHADWLKLATEGAWVFESIVTGMNNGQMKAQQLAELSESERLGESSPRTRGGAKSSTSRKRSGANTQTNSPATN